MITLHDKLYARTKSNVPLSTESFPLAFVTPYETDSAGKKRQETVDNWAETRYPKWVNGEYVHADPEQPPAHIIDNVPVVGFKITDVVSRYRTNNKFFEIEDPRGFSLQISAQNLFYLLSTVSLEKGVFTTPLVWGRQGENWLCPIEATTAHSAKKSGGLVAGDHIQVGGYEYLYHGKFFVTQAHYTTRYTYREKTTEEKQRDRYNFQYLIGNGDRIISRNWYDNVLIDLPKAVWIVSDKDTGAITMYKSAPKHVHVSSGNTLPELKLDTAFDLNENGYSHAWFSYLFDTSAAQKAMDRSFDRMFNDLNNNVDNYYRYSAGERREFRYEGNYFKFEVDKPVNS
jgi:hypothetical protein